MVLSCPWASADMGTFGDWLKQQRKEARLTQEELAERAGISKQYVSMLETTAPNPGTKSRKPIEPRRRVFEGLAVALGLPITQVSGAYYSAPELIADIERRTRKEANRGESFRFDFPASDTLSPALLEAVQQAAYQGGRDGALEVVRELSRIRERLDSFFAGLPVSLAELASAVEPPEDGG